MKPVHTLWPLAIALSLCGCASVPAGKADPRDRLERFNRSMYGFNKAADRAIVQPVARGYRELMPQPVRRGITNFMENYTYPRTIVNDLLQGKLADGGRDTLRLVFNTVGGLGFLDPASRFGLTANDEDFGQTLGRWGVPIGSYLVLPVLGPSTLRDAVGRVPDEYTTGRHYVDDEYVRYGMAAVDVIDRRASLLDVEQVLAETFDEYAFVRNAWLQRREYRVRDGDVPVEELAPEDESSVTTP
jgi:phospholipid-binding lipoprotein MlaA